MFLLSDKSISLRRKKKPPTSENVLWGIQAIRGDHETAELLQHLIEFDGGGSWPPEASHSQAWPTELRPYHDVYLGLSKLLPTQKVSLDNELNLRRCLHYRTQILKLLRNKVNLLAVKKILSTVEAGDNSAIPANAYNGFYACVAVSRHAFR